MTAKIVLNWLIGIFVGMSIIGILMGVYSAVSAFQIEDPDKMGKIAIWLFVSGGVAACICIIIRIAIGIVT